MSAIPALKELKKLLLLEGGVTDVSIKSNSLGFGDYHHTIFVKVLPSSRRAVLDSEIQKCFFREVKQLKLKLGNRKDDFRLDIKDEEERYFDPPL